MARGPGADPDRGCAAIRQLRDAVPVSGTPSVRSTISSTTSGGSAPRMPPSRFSAIKRGYLVRALGQWQGLVAVDVGDQEPRVWD